MRIKADDKMWWLDGDDSAASPTRAGSSLPATLLVWLAVMVLGPRRLFVRDVRAVVLESHPRRSP